MLFGVERGQRVHDFGVGREPPEGGDLLIALPVLKLDKDRVRPFVGERRLAHAGRAVDQHAGRLRRLRAFEIGN
jgi:hypothetical protein